MNNIIGVDIGGTNVDMGVVREDYEVIEYTRFKTKKDSVSKLLEDICSVVIPLAEKYDCKVIGIGSPGRTADNRTIIRSGNIPYDNTPVVDIVAERTGLEVYLDNDASCALYGEKFAGAGRDVSNMIVITIGTGIGGGIMIDRKTYHGYNNRAGEIGHFIIDINGRPCSCGLHGCFEQYASVKAFITRAKIAAVQNKNSILFKMAGGNIENLGGRLPFRAMALGCEVSEKVIEEYIYYLACGINSLSKIFQPDLFVLTGGLTNEGEIITDMLKPHLLDGVEVKISPLKGKAGLIGAALIKKERESYALPLEKV
ncbi:MAG: ROK family protein [Clostridiales bacterium]|jgi:glucokinase|nr:ROK family protein [Clostridiales bacterium]